MLVASEQAEIDSLLPATVRMSLSCCQDLVAVQRLDLKSAKSIRRADANSDMPKRDWAQVIDVKTPLSNFHELVPDMARKVSSFKSIWIL